ncbi:hypothetical protein M9978_07970 [Sphingomonas sp. MG17]|uniref:Uncharacterized protein n=1 Tax=Sphingomonas tagetis TaxID=2949092 RepID=A0A9X2HJR2_9SPHN|nr:hypothetical protein [Sphingomonas tagetis]
MEAFISVSEQKAGYRPGATGLAWQRAGRFKPSLKGLSYKRRLCLMVRMGDGPRWRERAEAIEYAIVTVLLLGSFVAGALGFVRWLVGEG